MALNKKTLAYIFLFIALNAAAVYGAHAEYWPWRASLYFFWLECALTGVMTLFLYAKHLVIFFFLLFAAGWLLGLSQTIFFGDVKIPIAFWGAYSICWLIYFEIRKSPLGQRIRLTHPVNQLGFYLFYMLLAIGVSLASMDMLLFGRLFMPVALPQPLFAQLSMMVLLIPTLTIMILKIVDMIGARHFLDFLFGVYHRPVERKRIIGFLDMVGSTGVAEKLSAKGSMEFIARFIFDAGLVFRTYGGDIINYTGDGLVILWDVDQADRALAAVDALSRRLETGRQNYQRKFDAMPDFRLGLHAGEVVMSQIGEEKLFLGLYGDAVNTASRIEQMNKTMGTRVLFSRPFRRRITSNYKRNIISMGMVDIPGKEETIEVFTVK